MVLPELATSGYVFNDADEARRVALAPDELGWDFGPVVIGGFCERGANGTIHNSAAVFDDQGLKAVCRKSHLWDKERLIFTPGVEPPPVIDTAHGRIGA